MVAESHHFPATDGIYLEPPHSAHPTNSAHPKLTHGRRVPPFSRN